MIEFSHVGLHPADLCLRLIGSLRPHEKSEGCWVGMMGDQAITLIRTDSGNLALFENPAATLAMNADQVEAR